MENLYHVVLIELKNKKRNFIVQANNTTEAINKVKDLTKCENELIYNYHIINIYTDVYCL